MNRITIADLELQVHAINEHFGVGDEPAQTINGQYVQNVGVHYLAQAYGGIKLEIMCEHGSNDVSTTGFGTKRDLHVWMGAYLRGLRASQAQKVEDAQ